MNNSALITMILVQGTVTIITIRIFYMVLRPKKNRKQK